MLCGDRASFSVASRAVFKAAVVSVLERVEILMNQTPTCRDHPNEEENACRFYVAVQNPATLGAWPLVLRSRRKPLLLPCLKRIVTGPRGRFCMALLGAFRTNTGRCDWSASRNALCKQIEDS